MSRINFIFILAAIGLICFLLIAVFNKPSNGRHVTKTYVIERYLQDGSIKRTSVLGGDIAFHDGGVLSIRDCCYPYHDHCIIGGDFIITIIKEEPCPSKP